MEFFRRLAGNSYFFLKGEQKSTNKLAIRYRKKGKTENKTKQKSKVKIYVFVVKKYFKNVCTMNCFLLKDKLLKYI